MDVSRRLSAWGLRAAAGHGSCLGRVGGLDEVAEPPHRLDQVHAEFLAQTADEDLDRVGIAIEVLVVEMLDQFGAGRPRGPA